MLATRTPVPFTVMFVLLGLAIVVIVVRSRSSLDGPPPSRDVRPPSIIATRPPPPPPAKRECSAVDDLSGLSPDERTLAELWRARHPCGELPPPCGGDPVAVLHADLDDAPGLERVIANARFGVAMYAADGRLLADNVDAMLTYVDNEGASRCRAGTTYVHLASSALLGTAHPQIVVRTRGISADTHEEIWSYSAFARRGAALEEIVQLELERKDGPGTSPEEIQSGMAGGWSRSSVEVARPGQIVLHHTFRWCNFDAAGRCAWRVEARDSWQCTLRVGRDGRFHGTLPPDEVDMCRQEWDYAR
jgi:hypothetical protein